ncbi:MAG: MurR/RpiR family transcriptional regulator [Acidobacteriota bacterium]
MPRANPSPDASSTPPRPAAPELRTEADVRALVHRHHARLPRQQQLVADYVLDQLRELPFLSVPELAKRSGASEATVVRFAQRIGYAGFSELKMALLEVLRARIDVAPPALTLDGGVAAAEREAAQGDPPLTAVARQEVDNIQRTIAAVDARAFRRLATALFKADHVYVFGQGISSTFADLLTYLLTQIGLRATVMAPRFTSPLEPSVVLRPSDLLLAFSFPPYSRQTIALVEAVAARGVPTAVICDRPAAPAAHRSGHALAVRTDNLLFTNACAAVVTILNALVTEIASHHQDHTVDAVSQINRILRDADEVVTPPAAD